MFSLIQKCYNCKLSKKEVNGVDNKFCPIQKAYLTKDEYFNDKNICKNFVPDDKYKEEMKKNGYKILIKNKYEELIKTGKNVPKQCVFFVKNGDDCLQRLKFEASKNAFTCGFKHQGSAKDTPYPLRFICETVQEKDNLLNSVSKLFGINKNKLSLSQTRSASQEIKLVSFNCVHNDIVFPVYMTDRFFYSLGTTSQQKVEQILNNVRVLK